MMIGSIPDEKALELYRQIKDVHPDDPQVYLQIGLLHVRLDQSRAAEQALTKATQLAPQQSSGYLALARLYLKMNKRLPEAKSHAEKAVNLRPTAPACFLLSRVCERGGDLPGAISAIERAIELDSANAKYRRAYQRLQRREPAP